MALSVHAAHISPSASLTRALNKFDRQTKNISGAPRAEYCLAMRGNDDSYYIFSNPDGGFIVTPGDTRVTPLLAYSPAGTFDPTDMPEGLRSLLRQYEKEIKALEESRDPGEEDYDEAPEESPDLALCYNRWETITPIVRSRWTQSAPYNDLCPMIGSRHAVVGCLATAMAQQIRAIGFAKPQGGILESGSASFDFDEADFDFSLLRDSYTTADSCSVEESLEVSRLSLSCGLAVEMKYGASTSSAYSERGAAALRDYFGYGPETRHFYRDNMPAALWETILYDELLDGRPVVYSGTTGYSGHSFIIDGYMPAGMWHVNWGWGGSYDGYFRLSALAPSTGSAAYSLEQDFFRALPPGTTPRRETATVAGSLSLLHADALNARFIPTGMPGETFAPAISLFNNDGHRIATAIIDTIRFTEPKESRNFNELSIGTLFGDFPFSDLPEGDYRLYPEAILSDLSAPTRTEAYPFYNPYITLQVSPDGVCTFSDSSDSEVLRVADISDVYLPSGLSGSITVSLVNVGKMDFKGLIYVGIGKNSGGYLARWSREITVPAQTRREVTGTLTVKDTGKRAIQPGSYPLYMIIKGKPADTPIQNYLQVIPAPDRIFDPEGPVKLLDPPTDMTAMRGDKWDRDLTLETTEALRGPLKLSLFNSPDSEPCLEFTFGPDSIPVGEVICEPRGKTPYLSLPMGIYKAFLSIGDTLVTEPFKIEIHEEAFLEGSETPLILTADPDNGGACLLPHPGQCYEGHLSIPTELNTDYSTYTLTSIAQDAFVNCRDLESVDIPESVVEIGADAFTFCPSLQQVTLRADTPPFSYRQHVAAGLEPDTHFYTSAEGHEKYDRVLGDRHPVFAALDSIGTVTTYIRDIPAPVTVPLFPLHEALNPDFTVMPVDSLSASVAKAEIEGLDSDGLRIIVTPLVKEGQAFFRIITPQRGIEPGILRVEVSPLTSKPDIEDTEEASSRLMFDLKGLPLKNGNDAPLRITLDPATGKSSVETGNVTRF